MENKSSWNFLQNHIQHSLIIFLTGLDYTPIDFNEQVKHIRGPQTNFTFSLRTLNSHLLIFKTLELQELTNRNHEHSQSTNRKRRRPQRNLVEVLV